MSAPGAGFEYPARALSWLKRDVLLFAASIGCTEDELHFLYELHPNFQTFPTYAVILPFKGTDLDVIDFYARQSSTTIPGIPKLDSTRVVDGQRIMNFYKPLPPSSEGSNFEIRMKVLGVYDKGKPGTVVETEQLVVNKDTEEVYTRATGQAFFTGQGGWGGPKGEKGPAYNPPEGKQPDFAVKHKTYKETPLLYRLNGDYNPLHADPEPGKKMGFGGTIMHGLYSWNLGAHALLKEFGGSDSKNLREYQARFAAPVIPGDELEILAWKTSTVDKDGFEEVIFVVKKVGGKIVLSNGRALIKSPKQAKL